MKSTDGRWLKIFLLCLIGLLHSNSMMAQTFDISDDDIDGFVDYLLCDYNVSISETDLEAALNGLIAPEDVACDPIYPELTASTATTATFEWAPTGTAIDYTVASIGLTDGVVFQDVTPNKTYTFTGLTPQEYLFVFIANCVNGASIAEIIIVDMDVYYPNNNFSILDNCLCKRGTPTFDPIGSCPFYASQVTYLWQNGACDGVKYNFTMTENGESDYEEDIWIFNHTTSEVNLSAMNCSDLVVEENGIEGFTVSDPGNFDAILTSEGIHFYMVNTAIQVDAMKCGCFDNLLIPKIQLPEEAIPFKVAPNPFSDRFSIGATIQIEGQATISLIGLDGKLMSTETIDVYKGNNKIEINTEHLPAGVYSLLFESNGQRTMERVVKI